jgi:hypothetical protein
LTASAPIIGSWFELQNCRLFRCHFGFLHCLPLSDPASEILTTMTQTPQPIGSKKRNPHR